VQGPRPPQKERLTQGILQAAHLVVIEPEPSIALLQDGQQVSGRQIRIIAAVVATPKERNMHRQRVRPNGHRGAGVGEDDSAFAKPRPQGDLE
jgi:hypothetical protein